MTTYEPGRPDRFPAFLETRVYQGSSGRVYPLPFIESVSHAPTVREWQALHLENEYVRLMILPELGGRIHIAVDKTTGQDFFYRNNVIKPALVGLAGPWIAGGVEFNWPQHHRPGTFLPMNWTIEREEDGSVTVWCSDHDPFARMKGMHGIRLRPGKALVEARVRLFNRTEVTQTFLWWANVAVRVHDDYQSFFPADVHMVADHAKRAVTAFPAADRPYYGIDYPARADRTSEAFVAEDGDRLDWYKNIPVPTSYMCVASDDDFFGGYDHAAQLGFAHVADHRIAPGKKQWTWGNSPFGRAWDRNLSDGDGPYVELMAGVYTDNQPDFSYLAPGETKTFSQYWFPYHRIGPLNQATTEVAVSLVARPREAATEVVIGVATTVSRPNVEVRLLDAEQVTLWQSTAAIDPGAPFETTVVVHTAGDLDLIVSDGSAELARATTRYRDAAPEGIAPATAPLPPAQIETVEELYLTGVHLAQYRHATRSPEPYWDEVLRRDPAESRTHVALARLRLEDGRLADAEAHLRTALERQTFRNPNPSDGEASYLLGVVLAAQENDPDAEKAFAKSGWNYTWRTAARIAQARIAARDGRWADALAHAEAASGSDPDQLQALAIRICALRQLGRVDSASGLLEKARALDPLDAWLRSLDGDVDGLDAATLCDVAGEYRSIGLLSMAVQTLDAAAHVHATDPVPGAGNRLPLIHYERAELLEDLGDLDGARSALNEARSADSDQCFAASLADARLLERRIARSGDARAHALLGHWLYFHRRYQDAVGELEAADRLQPGDPVVLRGLGLAAYNVHGDAGRAADYYRRARMAAPDDAKLLHESDQLARRMGVEPSIRLEVLQELTAVTMQRDDLALAFAELLSQVGRPQEAVDLMKRRPFSPWEGGEGEALRVWSEAHRALAARAMADGEPVKAVAALEAALNPPDSLGEAWHPLANLSDLLLALGDASAASGDRDRAEASWNSAAQAVGDFTSMSAVVCSPMTYFSILAAGRLGDRQRAEALRTELRAYVEAKRAEIPSIDYFATSLPTMLTFREDVDQAHADLVATLEAQLAILEDDPSRARQILIEMVRRDPSNALALTLLGDSDSAALV